MEHRKNEICELTITGYTAEGMGVGRLDGLVVFVPGTCAGEVCRVKLLKVNKTVAWGKAEKILTSSPERIAVDCPYNGRCGGCQYRHMTYAEELRAKRARVDDALERIGGLSVRTDTIRGAAYTERYRNKIQFPCAPHADGSAAIGYFRARTHDVLDVEDCLLQGESAAPARAAVKEWMERYGVRAYDESDHTGCVRHVYVRENRAGQCLCCVLVNGKSAPHEEELAALLRERVPGLAGVVLGIHEAHNNVILGEGSRTLWGQDYLMDTLCGLSFKLSVPSFYQVNAAQAEVLYSRALAFAGLTGRETVLDLYCGIGTISLVMARAAGRVIGVEVVPEAVEDAQANALRNAVDNAEFFCADALEAARTLAARGVRPDVVCVDPPRKGLAEEVPAVLAGMAPERIVYVSCDPGTLARDLARFAQLGYESVRAEAVDLFPRTKHVETVVLLSQQRPNDKIRVELDLTEFDITAAEKEATYQEIKDYVFEKHGVKVSSLYIAQVKEKLGIKERENYNLPKSSDSKQPQCPEEKEKMIVEALKHFKMI